MVCGYLMFRDEVASDRDGYLKYDEYVSVEPFFEMYKTKKLFDVFRCFGYDGTDNNIIGEVEITDEQFDDFKEDFKEDSIGYNEYDIEILQKIDGYFKDGNWLLQLKMIYGH